MDKILRLVVADSRRVDPYYTEEISAKSMDLTYDREAPHLICSANGAAQFAVETGKAYHTP